MILTQKNLSLADILHWTNLRKKRRIYLTIVIKFNIKALQLLYKNLFLSHITMIILTHKNQLIYQNIFRKSKIPMTILNKKNQLIYSQNIFRKSKIPMIMLNKKNQLIHYQNIFRKSKIPMIKLSQKHQLLYQNIFRRSFHKTMIILILTYKNQLM